MSTLIDFIYMSGDCPSDGCPEYFFNNKSSFENEYAQKAFSRAMKTIKKYSLSNAHIPNSSPLKNEREIKDFTSAIQKYFPGCQDVTTIYSCKHGRILYQRSIRFSGIHNIDSLSKKIEIFLPANVKERNILVEDYLIRVE